MREGEIVRKRVKKRQTNRKKREKIVLVKTQMCNRPVSPRNGHGD
jgi:hypothetical protein